ncbi:MAG: radical SAM protein [Rhodothermales bacterium]
MSTEKPFVQADATDRTYRPSLVSWNLTRKCNLKCPHCYMEGGTAEENELTTDECLSLIDEMRALGTEMLILTGGEPLLRRDIYEIARTASESGIWVVMGTNGVLVTDRVAEKMVECGVKGVGISLDSIDPEKHNRFRGGPNAWQHSVRALDTCRRHGLEVLVQTTVMDMNRDELPQLMAFAREKGAWSFNVYFLVQTGRGQQMNDLSAEDTDALLRELAARQDDFRPMLVRSKCAPQFKQIAYEMGRGGLESGGCMAGTHYCRITPSGDVTPCPYMTVVAGNVREQSFEEVWTSSTVLRSLRDRSRLKGRCGACEFNELCGGCRCRAQASFGDYLQEDPACTYQPTGEPLELSDVTWTADAKARLERIPIRFIRQKVRKGLESYADRHQVSVITQKIMQEALAGMERPSAFKRLPSFDEAEPAAPEWLA